MGQGRANQMRPPTLGDLSAPATTPASNVINMGRKHQRCAGNWRTCLFDDTEGARDMRAQWGFSSWVMVQR